MRSVEPYFGGEPDIGTGIGSEPPAGSVENGAQAAGIETGGGFRFRLCGLLRNAKPWAREAFCRSQPEPEIRAACWRHVGDSPVSWQNWCYDTFGE